jgi:putative tryptophan/tyrosine transport system substrate-binding protein
MRRREFIALLGGAAAWPVVAHAQQAMPVIGFLSAASPDLYAGRLRAFHQGLREAGYTEGQNVAIEYRWAHGQNDRLPGLAAELVRYPVTLIVSLGGIPAAVAAKAATTSIPIVFHVGGDPVEVKLVASLARPGGNVTGVTTLSVELVAKRLELLHEMIPTAGVVALLVNPTNQVAEPVTRDVQAAARTLGLKLHVLHASTELDFDVAFARLGELKAGALVVGTDSFFISQGEQLGALAFRHGVPAIFQYREFAAAGGLASYGGSGTDPSRQVGVYTARILKGEKAADLPVQQEAKVELIINLKAAKALGVNVPPTLLARADEVIE